LAGLGGTSHAGRPRRWKPPPGRGGSTPAGWPTQAVRGRQDRLARRWPQCQRSRAHV